MLRARFVICHEPAAPRETTSITCSRSRPARRAKWSPSARPSTTPAMQIWFTSFVSWPVPWGPIRVALFA
jgi:hypothetical protein